MQNGLRRDNRDRNLDAGHDGNARLSPDCICNSSVWIRPSQAARDSGSTAKPGTDRAVGTGSTKLISHFLAALTLAHLARFAALIRARPAADMRRLAALIGKTFWPLAFAQRTFCAAEIRARAAADIFRRGLDDPVLYVPAKAASCGTQCRKCPIRAR